MDLTTKINTNTNTDELQNKINAARAQLSEETRSAIDAVDWKVALQNIRDKQGYNLEQLQDLEDETELLLCGLTNPENFSKELENRMKIPKIEADTLINQLNESIFKKIRDELMKENDNKTNTITNDKKDTDILNKAGIEIMPEEITAPKTEKENIKKDTSILNDAGIEITNTPTKREFKEGEFEKRNDMISEVENPDLINKIQHPISSLSVGQMTTANIDKDRMGGFNSIATQKLSGSYNIPTQKTSYSLPSMSKDNTATTKSSAIKADPYREIPE